MSDETIRALERELRRQGEDVMVLRSNGGLKRAEKGHCLVCRAASNSTDVRELDLGAIVCRTERTSRGGARTSWASWIRICRSCLSQIVAQTIDPQCVASVTTSGGALYIHVVERQ